MAEVAKAGSVGIREGGEALKKPNCYEFRHRRDIPGDAHSMCSHPEIRKTGLDDNYIAALAQSFMGKASGAAVELGIRGGG